MVCGRAGRRQPHDRDRGRVCAEVSLHHAAEDSGGALRDRYLHTRRSPGVGDAQPRPRGRRIDPLGLPRGRVPARAIPGLAGGVPSPGERKRFAGRRARQLVRPASAVRPAAQNFGPASAVAGSPGRGGCLPLDTTARGRLADGRGVMSSHMSRWVRGLFGDTRLHPYPITIAAREFAPERIVSGNGTEVFDGPEALAINRARLEHLASLGLDLAGKTVLDVGCGVGHLAQFFVQRRCEVICIDGRAENIESLRTRYPGVPARVVDIRCGLPADLGPFDVVFCYGLLYHLEDPVAALRHLARACTEMLLLETLVCDSREPVMQLVDEPVVANQAVGGLGSRPSPSFVAMALNRGGFPLVYGPVCAPAHPDFTFSWKNDGSIVRGGYNLRCVLVAARRAVNSPALAELLCRGAGAAFSGGTT